MKTARRKCLICSGHDFCYVFKVTLFLSWVELCIIFPQFIDSTVKCR